MLWDQIGLGFPFDSHCEKSEKHAKMGERPKREKSQGESGDNNSSSICFTRRGMKSQTGSWGRRKEMREAKNVGVGGGRFAVVTATNGD